jgi:large subunit ribosomal protein L24
MAEKLRLRKGDRVVVLSGKDIGKEGEISRVIPERRMAIVDGINVARKHQRATRSTQQGGIIDKDMPIHMSNLALLCSSCGRTRVGYRIDDDGSKVRVCKKCGKDL